MAETKKTSARGTRLRTIELWYKPVFDVHLNMAIDFYGKIQINDKSIGIMQPEIFVPVAEKSNQICELEKWAVEEACDAMKRCAERDADINSVILWTSLKHLKKKTFLPAMQKILKEKEVSSEKFCFYITENILPADAAVIAENIKAVRDAGFEIAIDDFGVEYSSLTNLGQYDVDYIGIHGSLVTDILTDERTQNMIQGIIDFCKKLNTRVMVGGIDSPEKAEMLKKMGVDRLAGSLYGDFIKEKSIG
ncbi:Phytochrome-like protein cph2 [bioreactor metagenome]|uniref:Phytochrome-like protein cph2 n=1 Tax=bioreactor metagenome TaxID=1076179 RepID=A0A645AKK2_9ZZZZ